jgi:MoxR-like ATPase
MTADSGAGTGRAEPGRQGVSDWLIYRGTGEPHDGIDRLPAPPPWRAFEGEPPEEARPRVQDPGISRRLGANSRLAELHRPVSDEVEVVNAALYLRRPLLITGSPGTGKSTLAHAVAHELRLGRVLRWPIVSSSTLQDGLYQYDAIGRLQDANLARHQGAAPGGIGRYLRLGPLGTALLPTARPRVVLVDELDKSDIDLPNDLLNVLEEGAFAIRELERIADLEPEVQVLTDDGEAARIHGGRVLCRAFPLVVLTSNGERDFPPALLRRCIRLELQAPDHDTLATMVRAHLGEEAARVGEDLIQLFLERSASGLLAADQLLNAIYLTQEGARTGSRRRLAERLMQRLDRQR